MMSIQVNADFTCGRSIRYNEPLSSTGRPAVYPHMPQSTQPKGTERRDIPRYLGILTVGR